MPERTATFSRRLATALGRRNTRGGIWSRQRVVALACRIASTLAATAFMATLAACEQDVSHTRYKETLTVSVNGRLESNSSVVGFKMWREQSIDEGLLSKSMSIGEPPLIDLGNGRVLFATWDCEEQYDFQSRRPSVYAGPGEMGYPYPGTGSGSPSDTPYEARPGYPSRCVRPLLVTFRNLSDPTSVEPVDLDNPSATLGNGVRPISIHHELTTEPITRNVTQKYLPWISLWPMKSLDGKPSGRSVTSDQRTTLAHALTSGAFTGQSIF